MLTLPTETLVQLIRAKLACLIELRDMGVRQLELIEAGNITALLDVLSAKQRPLAQLRRIEQALTPFHEQPAERRIWPSPATRAACAGQARQCETLLCEIIEQEGRSEALLVRRRDAAALQLQEAHHAGRARDAYIAAPRQVINQLDLRSEN
ncbi:MAG: hypothetical protein ABSG68_19300 [Thermoguttaceae bacterium]|jgi:hypothetical protein